MTTVAWILLVYGVICHAGFIYAMVGWKRTLRSWKDTIDCLERAGELVDELEKELKSP